MKKKLKKKVGLKLVKDSLNHHFLLNQEEKTKKLHIQNTLKQMQQERQETKRAVDSLIEDTLLSLGDL
jgi:hypothetical protein